MRIAFLLTTTVLFAAGVARADDAGAILDANQKAAGGAAWAGKASVEISYAYAGQGLTGTVSTRYDLRSGAFVDTADLGPNQGANGFDGREAWMRDVSGAITPQAGGDVRQLAFNEAYRDANLWWRADRGGADVRSLGVKTESGQSYDVLSITPKDGKAFEAWFDAQTHLLARTIEPQGAQTITTSMSDYRPQDGARFEVHVEKSRAYFGNAGQPFEASLVSAPDGHGLTWAAEDLKRNKLAEAAALFRSGVTIRAVAAELGIARSSAGRLRQKAQEDGLLDSDDEPEAGGGEDESGTFH